MKNTIYACILALVAIRAVSTSGLLRILPPWLFFQETCISFRDKPRSIIMQAKFTCMFSFSRKSPFPKVHNLHSHQTHLFTSCFRSSSSVGFITVVILMCSGLTFLLEFAFPWWLISWVIFHIYWSFKYTLKLCSICYFSFSCWFVGVPSIFCGRVLGLRYALWLSSPSLWLAFNSSAAFGFCFWTNSSS